MKAWQCMICGHIHKGEEPPERCPICGAPKAMFKPLESSEGNEPAHLIEAGQAHTADIIIIGSGAAGLVAAITARSHGASVIVLEKSGALGGTTARSGGGFWVPCNHLQEAAGIADTRDDALRYMARYSYPNLYQPNVARYGLPPHEFELLEAYVDAAPAMTEWLLQLGALQVMQEINWQGRPQVDYMDHLPENKGIRGRSLYPMSGAGKQGNGTEMINQLTQWARAHDIALHANVAAKSILRDAQGRVIGISAVRHEAGKHYQETYHANRGVIFGSGGYSHNPAYMLHFQRGPHYGGCAVPTNTGDFVAMAGTIGAQLGNMAGAFRAQSILEIALDQPGGSSNVFYIPGDSVLEVDRDGQRVMNEKRNYTDRAMLHFAWDPQAAQWRNMLLFMIFDQRTATLWQGYPPYSSPSGQAYYYIQGQTWGALAEGIAKRLLGLASRTGGFTLSPKFAENLKATVQRFNGFAKRGVDEDFQRGEYIYDREWTTFPPTVPDARWPPSNSRNPTLYPLAQEGPYYAVILSAGTLDTNGGPVINRHGQVLDWADQPISGLYGAGNCIASPTANAYWGAGSTLGPAMTFGYLAALHALSTPL